MTLTDHILVALGIAGGSIAAVWFLSNALVLVAVAVGKAKRDRARRATR